MAPVQGIGAAVEHLRGSGLNGASGFAAGQGTATDLFGDIFRSAAKQANKLDTEAQSAVTGLLSGQGVEVHEAMIATQKADLQFELALQVRNKAVSAYQQLMQMQF